MKSVDAAEPRVRAISSAAGRQIICGIHAVREEFPPVARTRRQGHPSFADLEVE